MHIGAPSRSNGSARLLGGAVVRAMLVLAVGSAGLAWLAWPSSPDGANAASPFAAAPQEKEAKPFTAPVQAASSQADPIQPAPPQVASLPVAAAAPQRSLFGDSAPQASLPQAIPLRPSPPSPPASVVAFASPAPSSPQATQASQATPDAPMGASRSIATRAPAAPVKAAGPGPLIIEFPRSGPPPAAPDAATGAVQDKVAATAPPPAGPSGLVNLNTATLEQLNAIDGAGPVARAIVRGRPYASAEDLVTKRILRRSVYERIKDQVTVR
ncbi:MAG TPA: helix-hairpin-helix domain-containing protein [Microvirga sp.]|nr:helix-hairpin-helix domain-containing protein [Microvirga sp.]